MNENNVEPKVFCVYKHETPDGKIYIGQAKGDPRQRWQDGKGYRSQKFGIEAVSKYGWQAIKSYVYHPYGWLEITPEKPLILDDVYWLTQSEADYIENAAIISLDTVNHGWNVRKGSDRLVTTTHEVDEDNIKTNLNLSLNKKDINRIKWFAMTHNTSVSQLVVHMFNELYGTYELEG